jgi:DNA-binding transcriptional MerR regulator/methylmalonyl-CoA mutase cobalamin-binding subunit
MSRRPPVVATTDDALSGASIRVVANRTGIPAETLRIWERRYGFPRPSRRPGGSRVYSEDDIARLHLVARAIEAGFRPSEVVKLTAADLTRLVEASAAEAPDGASARGGARAGRSARPGATATAIAPAIAPAPAHAHAHAGTRVEAIVDALRADDLVTLRARLRAAAVALGPRAFVTDVAHPFAVRIGDLWAEGAIEVRHEHLASACLTSQLQLLLGALEDGDRSPSVLLATLPAEAHELGLDMVAVYLAASLAAPRLLGADTPAPQIAEAALALGVDAVGLSISPAADVRVAARAVYWLAAALPDGVELWLGGGGARAAAKTAPTARVIATWPELDHALTALRADLARR